MRWRFTCTSYIVEALRRGSCLACQVQVATVVLRSTVALITSSKEKLFQIWLIFLSMYAREPIHVGLSILPPFSLT